jgi:hypothetical protein
MEEPGFGSQGSVKGRRGKKRWKHELNTDPTTLRELTSAMDWQGMGVPTPSFLSSRDQGPVRTQRLSQGHINTQP